MARGAFLLLLLAAGALRDVCGAVRVSVDPSIAVAETHPTSFLSFSFDTTALFGVQRAAIPFHDPRLVKLSSNLAPAYVRIGGSLEDATIYNVTGDIPTPLPQPANYSVVYLSASKWDEVAAFCATSGLDMVLGLNAAVGRQSGDPSATLSWNASNVASLLTYIRDKGQRVPVVELGNEVNVFNCSGPGGKANMSAADLAGEHLTLSSLLSTLLPGTELWGTDSSITGDVRGQCHSYYGTDLFGFNRDWLASPADPSSVVDALTWHWYPQASINTTCDPACMLAQMFTYEYQTRLQPYDETFRGLASAYAPGKKLIMGETASYWAGGVANVSNRFASGFWYLQQSGYLASKGYYVQIRQDFAGGSYGLVDLLMDQTDNTTVVGYAPNPDYFTTALWKLLVGPAVLNATVLDGGPRGTGVWAWAFCAAQSAPGAVLGDVVIILTNFNNAIASVDVSLTGLAGRAPSARAEYLLSPPAGAGLDSQAVVLNGAALPLTLQADLSLPAFPPRMADGSTAVTLPGLTYMFAHLQGAGAQACM